MNIVKSEIAKAITQRSQIEAELLGCSCSAQERQQLLKNLFGINRAIEEMLKSL